MPSLVYFQNGVLVTGAAGFLGSHLCRAWEGSSPSNSAAADVKDAALLHELATTWRPNVILHLASKGTVLAPLGSFPEMLDVAVDGLVHLLDAFSPKRVLLPSSCSVYGDTHTSAALPSGPLHPRSVYGLSKVICERILFQWARATGETAIVLRMGNLIGPGGRGLTGYLVDHALRHPKGDPPAEMRGGGRMIRDYVPVDYVVRAFQAAIAEQWEPGQVHILNVGSGRPRTNGQVASVVQQTLHEFGMVLNIHYHEQPGLGEASTVVLDTQATEQHLGINPPSESDVIQAIREAVSFHLERAKVRPALASAR